VLSALLDLIFAPVCLGCDGPISPRDDARLICRRCRTLIRSIPTPACPRCGAPRLKTGRSEDGTCPECAHWPAIIHTARASALLYPPADRIVHQLKYRGWHALAAPMAERMAQTHMPIPAAATCRHKPRTCIPVPTTAKRKKARGYNQAELLAVAYAARVSRDEVVGTPDWLLRTSARGGSQTTLQPAARAANVAGAFALAADAHADVRGAHILLVDDVLTTGATAAECAQTLAAAGACCVSILTFARALDARRLIQT
jgi:ComF family protein